MTTLTPEEISFFQSALANSPEAVATFQIIEECDGNLEDATEVLVVEAKVEREITRLGFGMGSESLNQLTQKCREVICQEEFQEEVVGEYSREFLNMLATAVTAQLAALGNFPAALAIPIVMYVAKRGLKNFCKSSQPES